ncbi:oxidoreductase [Marinifilum caeruleilacunae]|uniref:SDR family NAD(P)-dependent oxidoreductase n=1 Tax=Marinifilum caeruleilacunae TaxID=2499076 RepID=A0ABX1X188_9BACT|nr:oxidoreductase [Marinifilum caeruleilacunae]NOU62079.1 SDR family NAD(P)-dependent oxidoreductase [Marinifilum caeruleilacunae]
MAKAKWGESQIPNQKGKLVIVTGSTSGIGKEAVRILTDKQATLVMSVRNTQKGDLVAAEIQSANPEAKIKVMQLDLSSLESIKDFAANFNQYFDRLDVLINNAGIMMCPHAKTTDGFEIQMGTNHLGHFALTGYLLPLLKKTKNSRIVVTSSVAHKFGKINLDDINWEKRKYNTNNAYGDSKIANLYFAYELVRKLKSDPHAPMVTAAHPGWTRTELQRHKSGIRFLNNFFSQAPEMGILPSLRAGFDPEAKAGDYYGPAKYFEMQGHPVIVKSNQLSHDRDIAKQLWDISEEMTGVKY